MLEYPDELVEYLQSSRVESRTVGLARYQGAQVEFEPAPDGDVSFNGAAEVQAAGSLTAFGDGDSLVPKSRTDVFAPFGQEVALFREVVLGESTWRIPLGVYRITEWSNAFEDVQLVGGSDATLGDLVGAGVGLYSVPSGWSPVTTGLYSVPSGFSAVGTGLYEFAAESAAVDPQPVVRGWSVDVDFADRFRMLQRAKLLTSKSPMEATMYAELQRLALMPVQQNPAIADVNIPAGTVYESGLIGAVYQLADLAGAVPHMTREGVLTLRLKDAWAETTLDPVFDFEGTIDWQDGMSDDFFNRVRASNPDGTFVQWAVLDDDSHPLSVNRAGPSDFEHVSPTYTSRALALAGAETVLERVLNRRSREVSVQLGPEAVLLELGDVGWVRDPVQDRAVLGEVSRIRVPNDVTEPVSVSLIVAEAS